jgi:large subunit ribosomal protein L9
MKGLDKMKVLLIKDVYKLGRAGDVKRVADGYGRNFLLPQGLAVLATAGALKKVENIRKQANERRVIINQEMSGIAEILSKLVLVFPAKAGETGKLYGSITTQMVTDAVKEKAGVEIQRRQIDFEPIRNLGTHKLRVRLTMDLIPELVVIVHREGESPNAPGLPIAEGKERSAKVEPAHQTEATE